MDHASLRDPRLLAQLAERLDGSRDPDTMLAREVARYYRLLERELATVRLSSEESIVLRDAVHAAEQARIAGAPFGSFGDAVASEWRRTEGLSDRRTVRREPFVARVAAWSPARTLAVIDACERLRARAYRTGWTTLPEMLREVGLLRDGEHS